MKILGYAYKLKEKPIREFKQFGWWDGERQEITIAAEIAPQAKESTVLHEVIHALDHMMEIGLEEDQTKRLEHGLYQVLTDNGVSLAPLLKELKAK